MMRRVFIVLVCILPVLCSQARAESEGHSVEVRSTSPKLLETEPGKIITASFLVASRAEDEEEFFEELVLPSGWWKVVSDDPSFSLEAEEPEVRVLAFMVPSSAAAGRYQIRYSVKSQEDYAVLDDDSLFVVVLPVVKLEILIDSKPQAVIAGDAYQVTFRLLNQGNSKTEVKLKTKSTPHYPVEIRPSQTKLEVGASQIVTAEIQTDEKLNRRITHVLEIQAAAEESTDGSGSVKKTVPVDIIPRVTGKLDPYHRMPIHAALVMAGQDDEVGFQMELSGSGSLDEQGRRMVDFLLRIPDIQDQSTYGKRDEFRVHYGYEFLDLHLGDRGYSLSPLTERASYGRGAEANVHRGDLGFGAFCKETRWQQPRGRELGTYLAYQLNDRLGLRANILSKSKPSSGLLRGYDHEIFSVQFKAEPDEGANLELECGLSDSDPEGGSKEAACRLSLDGKIEQVWYSFERIYAEPNYAGYYRDISYTNGTVRFPLHQALRGNLAFRSYKGNLDVDSARGTANREKSYRGGFSYHFPFGASVALDFEDLIREDYVLPAEYNYEERTWKLGLAHSLGELSVHARVERGRFENRLNRSATDDLERYDVYAHYRPDRRQTYSLYARTGHSGFTASPERMKSWGAAAAWQIKDNTSLNLSYRRDESGSEPRRKRASVFSGFSHSFPNKHALILRGQWSKNGGKKETDFSFFATYTVPLTIPVGKKTSIAVLKGKVYDEQKSTRPPISGVILTVHGATAITDKRGEFVFPSLKPEIYHLQVERSSIGLNRVATQKTPITVEVKGGETTELEIGVVTSCTISGRVAVFDLGADKGLGAADSGLSDDLFLVGSGEAESKQRDEGEAGSGLANILVEATSGEELLRQFTDDKGRFSFEDLRPGAWMVKVHEYDLPDYHYLEEKEFRLQLEPGDESEVLVRVLPRLRHIQMIEEGEID